MLSVSSYEPARVAMRFQLLPQFDPCSPQSPQQLSGRASNQIAEGRGFKSHLGLGFFRVHVLPRISVIHCKCFIFHMKVVYQEKKIEKCITFSFQTIHLSIYHPSEQYFQPALIGQLGGDQPSTVHLRAAEEKQNGFCRYIVTNKVTPWAASYSACVVYTKTIIHHYSPPLR